ncbi:H-NS histone family protein [Burkholderia pseudomallei]|uniref:H-NS histone family protein n=1 Tax=Burkholderia pseudomallei TaxID=28450 RepID=UPI0005729E4E|nr:H-NS histone family protein [Burkholderia pseudomallei]PJO61438.1 endonuclease [Burkholderia pseudomallei]
MTNRYLDLMKRHRALQEEIAAVRRHDTREIVTCIVQMMMYEICLDDISDALPRQQRLGLRRRRTPKYMDPESGRTWSGYGRPPRWMAGRDPAEFLLPAASEQPL